ALCLSLFSSRRRHTRFSRDWSSDVCSSDLKLLLMHLRHLALFLEKGQNHPEPPTAKYFHLMKNSPTHQFLETFPLEDSSMFLKKIGRASCRERACMTTGGAGLYNKERERVG